MSDLVKRLRIKAGMIEMGEMIAWGSDSALMREAADALEMAAPAVQGEPVAWSGWGCQYPGKMPRLYGERRIAELNCDWENGDQLLHFTAAPQLAEQKPVCPTCYGRGWDVDCQNESRPATCPDCAGSGKAEHSITVHESDSAAPDVAGLVEALEKVREQVDGNIRETVRDCVNGRPDVQDIYEYCDSIDAIIDTALAAHRKQGGDV